MKENPTIQQLLEHLKTMEERRKQTAASKARAIYHYTYCNSLARDMGYADVSSALRALRQLKEEVAA